MPVELDQQEIIKLGTKKKKLSNEEKILKSVNKKAKTMKQIYEDTLIPSMGNVQILIQKLLREGKLSERPCKDCGLHPLFQKA